MTRSEISKIHWWSDSPGSHVANGPAEDAEAETEDGHVAEIERRLEEAVHPARIGLVERWVLFWKMCVLCFEEEIVERVEVDVSSCGASS